MSDTTKPKGAQSKSGLRIPGFAQLQRLGKSLMLPIAVLPAAGILLRLGQPDLLGRIEAPVIGPFFKAMSAAGEALFTNLPLLFAVGVAIGFARKADGSTALAAVVGYLVVEAVFKTMSPIVLAGEVDKAGEQAQINYSVFAGKGSVWSLRGCSTATTPSNCRPTSDSSGAGASSPSWCRWPAYSLRSP
jgi:N-acetylglucosamine PTS system EIICBA or EIICB component